MKNRKEIIAILSTNLDSIRAEYSVDELGVFGSVARDEQSTTSDIDILVDFSKAVGMIKFLRLETTLQNLLGAKVDLVTRGALKKHIGQRILAEVKHVK